MTTLAEIDAQLLSEAQAFHDAIDDGDTVEADRHQLNLDSLLDQRNRIPQQR